MFIDLMTPRTELTNWIDEKIFILKMKGYSFNRDQIKLLTILFVCCGSDAYASSGGETSGSSGINCFYSVIFAAIEVLKGLSTKDMESIKMMLTKGK